MKFIQLSIFYKTWKSYGKLVDRYEIICRTLGYSSAPVSENKLMMFVTYRAYFDGLATSTIHTDLTGIKKYCVIYENRDGFAKMSLLKLTMKGFK